jgi:hypothetical protein
MSIFERLFRHAPGKQPEGYYQVVVTDTFISVEHPERNPEFIEWKNIEVIKLINTEAGPAAPDIWLALLGPEQGCLIPQGAKGFDEVYDVVSKYPGFDFSVAGKSFACTTNAEFLLWKRGLNE